MLSQQGVGSSRNSSPDPRLKVEPQQLPLFPLPPHTPFQDEGLSPHVKGRGGGVILESSKYGNNEKQNSAIY